MVLLVWAAAVYIFFNQWGESKSQRKSHPRKTFPSFSSPKLTDVVARPKNHFPPKLPNFSNLPSTRFPLRNEDKMVNLPERGPGAAGERLQRWGEAAKRCLLCGCCQDEGKKTIDKIWILQYTTWRKYPPRTGVIVQTNHCHAWILYCTFRCKKRAAHKTILLLLHCLFRSKTQVRFIARNVCVR